MYIYKYKELDLLEKYIIESIDSIISRDEPDSP